MSVVYENCRVYGPYKRKDGRKHVIIIFPNGNRKTVSYPKYLIEKQLNRFLDKDETVDHIDGNFHNDALSNLKVVPRKYHIQQDVRRLKEKEFYCPECNKKFVLSGNKLSRAISERKRGKFGPFCSRKCAGIYGRKVQTSLVDKQNVNQIGAEYTTLKQSLYEETHKVDAAKTGKP